MLTFPQCVKAGWWYKDCWDGSQEDEMGMSWAKAQAIHVRSSLGPDIPDRWLLSDTCSADKVSRHFDIRMTRRLCGSSNGGTGHFARDS